MGRLKEVIISITNRCNSFCRMCDIPKKANSELSTEQWKKTIEDAFSLGASTMVFSGGEPLLREDIFELISFTKVQGLNACITSNGLAIKDTVAKKLSEAGVDVVNISVEGPQEIHDYLRGKGSFDKMKDAINNLKKYNIETTLATVISRYNYRYLDYIVGFANETGATTIKFQPFSTLFIRDKSRKCDFFISQEESKELKEIIKRIVSSCDKQRIATNPFSYLKKIPSYMSERNIKGSKGCQALWTTCPISVDGEIYPCWILTGKDKLIGSISEKRFSNIWNSQKHNSVREEIINKGCPGCMMSCYDNVFGRDSIERKIVINTEKIRKEGFFRYIRRFLIRLIKRFKFYSSYRGSFKTVAVRAIRGFKRRGILGKKIDLWVRKEEINRALQEIIAAKNRLKKEIMK